MRRHNILPTSLPLPPTYAQCPPPPPSSNLPLKQLMHHNLNNNYVQYNFWWSKLTKTSLYQKSSVPTNKKCQVEFANLALFCKMFAVKKVAHIGEYFVFSTGL